MIITNIQRMSMNDGPGIRTTLFVKGCPLRCLWCHNPECMEADGSPKFWKAFPGSFYFDGDIESLCERLAKDRKFFAVSGGGVTVSGGEPLLYPEFVRDLGEELKKSGIDMAVDTCGSVPWENIKLCLSVVSLFLYDLKACESDVHKRLTGYDNSLIWKNLYRILEEGKRVQIRIPAIGNANEEELEKIAESLRPYQTIEGVEILLYHKYGIQKYRRLGMEYKGDGFSDPGREPTEKTKAKLNAKGIKCRIMRNKESEIDLSQSSSFLYNFS